MLRKLKISSFYATTRIISFCFKFFTSFNPVSQVHTESRIEQILRLVRVPRVLTRSMSYRKSGLGDIVHNIINLSIKLHETRSNDETDNVYRDVCRSFPFWNAYISVHFNRLFPRCSRFSIGNLEIETEEKNRDRRKLRKGRKKREDRK